MRSPRPFTLFGAALAVALLPTLAACTSASGPTHAGSPPSTATAPREEPDDGGYVDDLTRDADLVDVDGDDEPAAPDDEMGRMDAEIERAVTEALEGASGVDAAEIGVHVDDGEVFLSGAVGSEQERERVLEIVQAVEGVRGVNAKDLGVR